MKLIWITEATYLEDYKVWLRFNDGRSGEVDLAGKLQGPVFDAVMDPEVFSQFSLNSWTIHWECGADVAPEFLCDLVQDERMLSSQV